MKYLLTGMTSTQTNRVSHERSPNFPGLLHDALWSPDHEVTWTEASVTWEHADLDDYDAVIVGVSPLTGLGANRAYGALHVISLMNEDPSRLRLLVDAPDPIQMKSATKAIVDNPDNLTKDFYSYRKEYQVVKDNPVLRDSLLGVVNRLASEPWPKTIVPALPWHTREHFSRQLPLADDIELVNLDSLLFERFSGWQMAIRSDAWALEKGSNARWFREITNSVIWPVNPLPKTHRKPIWSDTMDQLASSEGCLISTSKSGTWWSPRYAMSLAVRTPVFSDWHETHFLDPAWGHLPSWFERLGPEERNLIADEQYETYYRATQEMAWTIG